MATQLSEESAGSVPDPRKLVLVITFFHDGIRRSRLDHWKLHFILFLPVRKTWLVLSMWKRYFYSKFTGLRISVPVFCVFCVFGLLMDCFVFALPGSVGSVGLCRLCRALSALSYDRADNGGTPSRLKSMSALSSLCRHFVGLCRHSVGILSGSVGILSGFVGPGLKVRASKRYF